MTRAATTTDMARGRSPAALWRRAQNRFRYELGRWLVRGTFSRLLAIAGLVLLVALIGGAIAFVADHGFSSWQEAVWWAFLRLTDPGYLGDDQGLSRRAISTVITVAGYVLFLGALVAIMTQWLNATMRRLESGLTPVARDGHVVVAGWTDRTVSILREMFRSEQRAHSLLGGRGRRLNAVVLAEEASPELQQELRERMGALYRSEQIVLCQGEPIHLDHLRRADFAHAAAIVLPGDPFLGLEHAPSDVRVMKALMSVARHAQEELGDQPLPCIVAEIFDARREAVAKSLYPGRVEIVASDRLIGRMLALNLRHPGLAHVYHELLFEPSGQRLSVVPLPADLAGRPFREATQRLSRCVVLGVLRGVEQELCPAPSLRLEAEMRLVLFAPDEEQPVEETEGDLPERHSILPSMRPAANARLRSLLVLGWTRKVPAVLSELVCAGSPIAVDVISTAELSERREELGATGRDPLLTLSHERADYTVPGPLERRELARYDAVLLVGSDRLESGSESDARTLVGYEVLKHCLARAAHKPRVVVELVHAENAVLIPDPEVEVLVSPQMLGRVLAQVALSPELCEVYDELFSAGGAELAIHRAAEYGIESPAPLRFGPLRDAVARAGHVLLGVQGPDGRTVTLNPPIDQVFENGAEVRAVVAVRAS